MTRQLRIRVTPTAAAHIREAADWSREQGSVATFESVIERAFELLSAHPYMGARAQNARLAGVRRLHLGRIRSHLYYRIDTETNSVQILALWHTRRGLPPTL